MTLGPPQRPVLDGSVRGKAFTFLEKLRTDDTTSGLHIEPITGTSDPRVRTGRVDQFWRAVLVKLTASSSGEAHYIYLGTYPHDDAIAFAKKARLQVNPASGVLELLREQAPAPSSDSWLPDQPSDWSAPPSASPATGRPAILARYGISRADLLDLGIAEDLADRVITEADENALADLTDNAPATWQGEALLELAAGTPLAEVRALYDLRPSAGDPTSDQSVLEALERRATRMEFAYVEDDAVLRDAIEDPDFGRWRLFLHPEQSRYAEQSMSGSFRLSGGAGTGKTVVLLHRAHRLAASNPTARIVLTTFNRTLAETLRAQLALLAPSAPIATTPGEPGIYVGTVDAITWHLVDSAARIGLPVHAALSVIGGPRQGSLLDTTKEQVWRAALKEAGWELPESLRAVPFVSAEYAHVVLPGRMTTRDDYLRTNREGRGVRLSRQHRSAVWDVIEAYRTRSAHAGTTDYDERALIVASALDMLAANGRPRLADHVLVDEAQDLSPSRLLLLRALVAPGSNDLFVAEDSQQRIYSQHVVPSHLGIHLTGRSRRLTLNYRTTAQTLRYAVGVLGGEPMIDMEETDTSSLGYRSSRVGPPPQEYGFDQPDEAYEAAANILRDWLGADDDPSNLAVLIRNRQEGENLSIDLVERGLPAKYVGNRVALGKGNVPVMTMHRAKGMEFRRVLLFGVSSDVMPAGVDKVPHDERTEKLQQERSLLYVAATRARDQLVIIWDGKKSELLPNTE